MLLLDGKNCWIFLVETAVLLAGICQTLGTNELKNILFISAKNPHRVQYPSKAVYQNADSGIKLCFDIPRNNTECCHNKDFNCDYQILNHNRDSYTLILNKTTLSKQDIVLVKQPSVKFDCMPSSFIRPGFLLNIYSCLNIGIRNIRLSQNHTCGGRLPIVEETCTDLTGTRYKIIGDQIHRVSCKPRGNISYTPLPSNGSSLDNAVNIVNNLPSLLKQLGDAIEGEIKIGDIKGVITKLSRTDQTDINVGFATSGDVSFLNDDNTLVTGFSRLVHIPKEASTAALKINGTFAGVLLFPAIHQNDSTSTFLHNEAVGIDMGTQISNLSNTIDIHYKNVDKDGKIPSCRSWDGKGKEPIWITDGCLTNETNDSITCHCSHLTFFAILMSPPPQNITTSDFKTLTYITSIGCGLSIFFLKVGLCMHCLIRKGKSSQATKLLMNLFGAMLMLNLCFLINESIANLENFGACVAIAAAMHYAMLATFSWFFIQALHLYFSLWKIPTEIKHYMMKVYITGWVTPAVVVIALVASKKYNYLVIYTDDGNSAKMCWIPDAIIHQGVNIGYYAIVFIFTFVIFIITVRQIIMLKPTAEKAKEASSIKTNSFSILGLFLLLGLTWAFAFFSHGPLRIPSYYIFTILNSFQGFFLFIYYYYSSKIVGDEKNASSSSSISATSNTVLTSPYK